MEAVKYVGATLLAFCIATGSIFGQITLPAEVSGQPGAFIQVTADTKGTVVQWFSLDPGLAVFPADLLRDPKSTVVAASKDGDYRLMAWTAVDNVPTKPVFTVIKVGKGGPVPNPVPNPDPKPEPEDPFVSALSKAWSVDTNAKKEDLRQKLATLYKVAATDIVNDKALNTVGDLFDALRKASKALFTDDDLRSCRVVISEELSKTLPKSVITPLDDANRKLCAKTFERISTVLEGLK